MTPWDMAPASPTTSALKLTKLRFAASQLLAQQSFPGVNRGNPIQLSLDMNCPPRHCLHCYHPDKPSMSVGHASSGCPHKDSMCTICHKVDHLTSACAWTAQSAFTAPEPRSLIPVNERLSSQKQPRRDRNRPSKRGRLGGGGPARMQGAATTSAAPPPPRSAAAVAASVATALSPPRKQTVNRIVMEDGSVTFQLRK